ncbi:MAG: neutral/alkaline non-lysosomal ceramidase N-terminal domain-containing protein [Planctomycetes bacterium]|nr:neutral/alkaline non-lysosomal ceramidase N-terminal domain-containing protein [Planctomycetota bacterium]
MPPRRSFLVFVLGLVAFARPAVAGTPARPAPAADTVVGVARVDITPDYPIRLSGFGFRRAESEGVTQRIWAKALALGTGQDDAAVLITTDNLGVPAPIVEEVAARLHKKAGIRRQRVAVTATHTHTGPMLKNVAPTLFGEPIPKEHQQHIDRYTRAFTDKLEEVALAALKDRRPARLAWGIGKVTFAINRRTSGGPVDHDLPVLVVKDDPGKIRAIYVSYACHCVTLSNNKISGDWAGFAQEVIERQHPGAVALVSIGCGGDSNPSSGVTGDKVDVAREQGAQIAAEVHRLLKSNLVPLPGQLTTRLARLELPFDTLPARAEWQERAKRKGAAGYHARVQLGRLDRGEKLQTKIDYPIQTWTFGDRLAMVFLPGEVVVDYALRLKRECDRERLWINAYSNDAPCYIPSERVLKEGGYEAGDAMVYYDRPTRLAPGLEQKIVSEVRRQLGDGFKVRSGTRGSRPLSPRESLARIRTRSGMVAERVAAEPLIESPVAIDFGPDGRLWVVEMRDYPLGMDGTSPLTPPSPPGGEGAKKPPSPPGGEGRVRGGGRIKVLEDSDGDGKYDKATIFLDKIPFPTGVTVWRKGVLVCTAPDILYAEDTDGDGKADVVKKLFTGFATHNYQARVNSLQYGLDGWVYAASGLFGGKIRSFNGKEVDLSHRDFRFNPDTGDVEPVSGVSQQGRVRDDWDDWFGCDSGTLARHFPLVDRYVARNRHVAPPSPHVALGPPGNRLFPASQDLQLFKLSGPPGRPTAACGVGVYRDDLLGKEYTGNVFSCEPVNLLVHRMVLSSRGATLAASRAAGEEESEFLASTDGWFRPVQVRTGPGGALWVVDMYRYVIEHPRWIPPETLEGLDVRAGAAMGRIYRFFPKDRKPRQPPRLDKLDTGGLVAALDSPNGTQRDLAQQMLLWKGDKAAVPSLKKMARESKRAEARLHALSTLDVLGALRTADVARALGDRHPGVRRHAVRLSEKWLKADAELATAVLDRAKDADAAVRMQVAYTLGECNDVRAPKALAVLAARHHDDPYLLSAVFSSVNARNVGAILSAALEETADVTVREKVVRPLLGLTASLGDGKSLPRVIKEISTPRAGRFAAWQMAALADVLDALQSRRQKLDVLLDRQEKERVNRLFTQARRTAADARAPAAERLAALGLLGRHEDDTEVLGRLLVPQNSNAIQSAAVSALGRLPNRSAARALLERWESHSPALRAQVLDVLLGRDAWLEELFARLERGTVKAAHLDATRRARLLSHKDEGVRRKAEKLLGGAISKDRVRVIESYRESLSLKGDAGHGRAVFLKSCAVCHRLGNEGNVVGPDLAALSDRSPQALLVAILDPNRAVEDRYINYLAVTTNGRTFNGILAGETAASITLRNQEGKEQVLLRRDLEQLTNTGLSLMPEGVEKDLSKQDLADLMSYLANLESPKKFPGNHPAVVTPDERGEFALLATNAEIYGGEIAFEADFRNIGMWHGEHDRVVWRVRVEKAGRYAVHLDWACHPDSAGNAYILDSDPPLSGRVASTGGWDQYRRQEIGTITLKAGEQSLTFRPDGQQVRRALLDLRAISLVPVRSP